MTGGTARAMAEESAAQARQELVAVVCVDRFMAAPDAGNQLTALREIMSSYTRGKFIQDGGWAVIPVSSSAESAMSISSSDHRKAAGLCAEELAKREIPEVGKATPINDAATRGPVGGGGLSTKRWGRYCPHGSGPGFASRLNLNRRASYSRDNRSDARAPER